MQTAAEPLTDFVNEIERDLRDYKRMADDIDRITTELQHIGGSMTARWDDMPKHRSGRSDPTGAQVVRRERKWRQLQRLQERVNQIDRAAEHITDTRQMILLDMLLDGRSQCEIGAHMRLSRSYLYEIRQDLIYNLARAAQRE